MIYLNIVDFIYFHQIAARYDMGTIPEIAALCRGHLRQLTCIYRSRCVNTSFQIPPHCRDFRLDPIQQWGRFQHMNASLSANRVSIPAVRLYSKSTVLFTLSALHFRNSIPVRDTRKLHQVASPAFQMT